MTKREILELITIYKSDIKIYNSFLKSMLKEKNKLEVKKWIGEIKIRIKELRKFWKNSLT